MRHAYLHRAESLSKCRRLNLRPWQFSDTVRTIHSGTPRGTRALISSVRSTSRSDIRGGRGQSRLSVNRESPGRPGEPRMPPCPARASGDRFHREKAL